jgi:hypothetical protein
MRSPDIENACMVVRTPVARAAAAIGTRTTYRGSAARGPGVLEQRLLLTGRFFRGVQGPSRPRKNLPESQGPETSTCEPHVRTAARVQHGGTQDSHCMWILHNNTCSFVCW